MLNVVLVEPEIAQNAGNVARTCACTGSCLHLIEPLGFRLTDKYLKRSGLDYWDKVELTRWTSLDKFMQETGLSAAHPKKLQETRQSAACPAEMQETMQSAACLADVQKTKQSTARPADVQKTGLSKNPNFHLFTGRTSRTLAQAKFNDGDYLLFGRETAGLPPELLTRYPKNTVRLPMRDNTRSLNLANSVAIGLYEGLRQLGYAGLV